MKRIKFLFATTLTMVMLNGFVHGQDTTLTVTSAGKVGIGTTTPTYKLEIEGGATPLRITGGGPQFQKFLFDVATGGFAIFRVYDKDVNEDFRFATNGDSWLNGAGNVGIGTTLPLSRLHIEGPNQTFGNFQNLFVRTSSPSAINRGGGIGFGGRFSLAGGTTGFAAIAGRKENSTDGNGAGYLGFATNDGMGAIIEKVRITSAGNVGIGTTSPQATLEVHGAALIRETGFTGNAGGAGGGVELRGAPGTFAPGLALDNGSQQWNIVSWSDNSLKFVKSTGTSFTPFTINNNSFQDALVLASNGVGIGTATPNNPLEMASGAHVTAGGVWTDASSRAYKENISSLTQEEAISTLEQLNPVKFNYKVQKDEEYVGFIAEDVPKLVATSDRKSLSPMDIVAVLTKVVQQQQKKIAELEARLNASQ